MTKHERKENKEKKRTSNKKEQNRNKQYTTGPNTAECTQLNATQCNNVTQR